MTYWTLRLFAYYFVVLVLLLGFAFADPPAVVFGVLVLPVVAIPILQLFRRRRRRRDM